MKKNSSLPRARKGDFLRLPKRSIVDRAALFESNPTMSPSTISRRMKDLMLEGVLTKHKHGQFIINFK